VGHPPDPSASPPVAGYDDVGRLISVNCGSVWAQTFSYDPFGNVTKSGSITWNPGYNSNNHYILAGTSYDADGDLLKDTFHTYTWDATGHPVTIDSTSCGSNGTCMTYDAFGRMVEKSFNSTFSEILYSPLGKSAVMSGQTLTNTYLPLPGGGTAFLSPNSHTYWHKDWLGSVRFASAIINRNSSIDRAFAPFGEVYSDLGGSTEISFTGDTQDTISKLYDTANRELHPTQGRWLSPDPAGFAAASFANPQSWNRYAYVQNSPLNAIDPTGLACFGPQKSLGLCNTAAGFGGNPAFGWNWTEFILLDFDLRSERTWNGERWGRWLIGNGFDLLDLFQQGRCYFVLVNPCGGSVNNGKGTAALCPNCHIPNYHKGLSCDVDKCTPAEKAQWCHDAKATLAAMNKYTLQKGAISLGATGIGAVASRVANVAEYTDPVLIPYGIIGGENMVLGDYIDSVCAE